MKHILYLVLLLSLALSITGTCFGISGQVMDVNDTNNGYYIASCYDGNDLRGIQYVQKNDLMYLAHPSYPVQKLSRYAHADWTIEDVNWQWGPFLPQNTTATTITPSGITGLITLIADGNIFDPNHVGALWEIIEKSSETNTKGTLNANESSAVVAIEGDALLTLKGTWSGLVTLEKSDNNSVWTSAGYANYNGSHANVEYAFAESAPGWLYRATMSGFVSGSADYTLAAYNSETSGYVKITKYIDANEVNATVQSKLSGTAATTKWAEGAWSEYRGYPRAICMYQNRLCLAGTRYVPNGFWASVSGDYENMRVLSLDTGAIDYEVGCAKQNPILWLQDSKGIIAGTNGSSIRIYSASSTATLTGNTIASERQAQNGSCDIQAQLIGDSLVYVNRNKRKVYDIIYDLQIDGFVTPELTAFAEHITDPCIVEVAVQNNPEPTLWYINGDGNCLTLNYNRQQGVVAWSKQITDGHFESVACIPNAAGGEDEVWFIIRREINDVNYRYVEKMKPQDWGTESNNCWFVDSGLEYDGNDTNVITGLSHLEGKLVQVFHDGNQYAEVNVVNGQIALDVNVSRATVGLPFTSTLMTFPVEVQSQYGFSVGFKKKIYAITGCFYKTMYGQYGLEAPYKTAVMYDLPFRNWPNEIMGTDAPFTGEIRLSIDGGWDDEVKLKFIQDAPYPFSLSAIVTKIEIGND